MGLDAEAHQCLDAISSSGEALLRIINDLLDAAKLDAGKLELEHTPLHVADLVSDTLTIMEPRAKERALDLTATLDPDIPPVLVGDALRLRQILFNLIGNAIKFTDRGSVSIGAATRAIDGDQIELEFSVSDTGKGIAPEAQDKLFSDYSQGTTDVARKYGGTGLGLAICRRLVALMGGAITLESEVGEGTTIRFTAWFGIDRQPDPPPRYRTPS